VWRRYFLTLITPNVKGVSPPFTFNYNQPLLYRVARISIYSKVSRYSKIYVSAGAASAIQIVESRVDTGERERHEQASTSGALSVYWRKQVICKKCLEPKHAKETLDYGCIEMWAI